VCVCVREREREIVCVCVRGGEPYGALGYTLTLLDREEPRLCVCVCICVWVC